MNFRLPAALAASATLALGVAACGDDAGEPSSSTATASSQPTAADTKPAAEIASIPGGTTSVTLDPAFVAALGSLKVAPGVLGTAKLDASTGTVSFPITGGNVKYFGPDSPVRPYVQGEVDHDGSGLSLTAGGKKVDLENFVVDPGASVLTGKVSVDGKEAAPSAPLFFLDGRTLKPITMEGTNAVLEGTTVKLKQEAADLLNQTFGIQDLKAGLVIGVAKISAETK